MHEAGSLRNDILLQVFFCYFGHKNTFSHYNYRGERIKCFFVIGNIMYPLLGFRFIKLDFITYGTPHYFKPMSKFKFKIMWCRFKNFKILCVFYDTKT